VCSLGHKTVLYVFGSVVEIVFQIAFHVKIHANDIFFIF
jgi:hypothetical protein